MRNPIASPGAHDSGRLRDLVRQATLAASSHNTQPWKFRLGEDSITILPDFTRRTPVVDPDDHHLFVSLGCATENMVHAVVASGLHADVRLQGDAIEVRLDETTPVRSPLFEAIPVRQCSRSIYDGHPFALRATALGIRTAFLNQPVEVTPLRSQFANWLNLGARRPDLGVRFGRGPEMPRSLRRPIERVLA